MPQQVLPANPRIEIILLALQVFQVLFLWFHDWIPFGRLNDVTAVRSQDTLLRLVVVTFCDVYSERAVHLRAVIQLIAPWAAIPALALHVALDQLRPPLYRTDSRLVDTLYLSLGTRTCRSLSDHVRQYTSLPIRNGLVPNTPHIMLHLATAATLFILLAR